MKPTNSKNVIVLLVVFCFAAAAVYGYLLFDTIQTGKEASDLYLSLHGKNAGAAALSESSLKALTENSATLDASFVDLQGAVPFMEQIEAMGKQVGVVVTISSIKNTNTSLKVNFKATGAFRDVYRFDALLESSPYKISVDSINLQNAGGLWHADFSVSLQSYFNK